MNCGIEPIIPNLPPTEKRSGKRPYGTCVRHVSWRQDYPFGRLSITNLNHALGQLAAGPVLDAFSRIYLAGGLIFAVA